MEFARPLSVALVEDDADFRQALVERLALEGFDVRAFASAEPAPAEQEHRFWYQYYLHAERGRAGLARDRRGLCRLLWRLWSPEWR